MLQYYIRVTSKMAGKLDISVPRAPSPLIRASRWVAFLSGVWIGAYQLRKYTQIEKDFVIQQAPLKVKLAEKEAHLKFLDYKDGMRTLYKEANGKEPSQEIMDSIK